jgi:hypothetical protein
MAAGRHAGRTGLPVTTCPFDPAGVGEQRALAQVWVREFLRNSPSAAQSVDYALEANVAR